MTPVLVYESHLFDPIQFQVHVFSDGTCRFVDAIMRAEQRPEFQGGPEERLLAMILDTTADDKNQESYTFYTEITDMALVARFRPHVERESKALFNEFTHFVTYLFWRDIFPQLSSAHRLKTKNPTSQST